MYAIYSEGVAGAIRLTRNGKLLWFQTKQEAIDCMVEVESKVMGVSGFYIKKIKADSLLAEATG